MKKQNNYLLILLIFSNFVLQNKNYVTMQKYNKNFKAQKIYSVKPQIHQYMNTKAMVLTFTKIVFFTIPVWKYLTAHRF
jgi:hypothetical protein